MLWDRVTGVPIGRAVNWQDTRTDALIEELADEGGGHGRFADACGLPLATYFAGPRIRWMLDATPGLRKRAERGEVLFGTMETWLIWNLTGGVGGRRARHRRDQRQPDDADGHLHPGSGRTSCWPPSGCRGRCCRRSGRPPRCTARRPRCCPGCPSRPRSATSRRRCSASAASPRARPSARTGPARSCCSTPAPTSSGRRTGCSPRSATRSATTPPCTRWRARSRSPARWCSGSGTTSG